MKKVLLILIIGLAFSTTVHADKIKYYAATSELIKEMGENGTVGSTFYYVPGTIVSATIETVAVPAILFWNIFQK